jgi:hypothetical protein
MTAARVALALIAASALACKAQESEFYAELFPCNLAGAPDECGRDRDGQRMTCYPASQLGGTDFCTATCDPANPPADPRVKCLASGALLRACRPHAGASDPTLRCPAGLSCYRTDLLADEGVCLMMQVCSSDRDCKDPTRSVCAATIVKSISPLLAGADNLQCIQPTCKSSSTNCAENEACLANFFVVGTGVSDICIPKCDGQNQCPPNFACARTPTYSNSPALCLPGLPGQRCQTDQDCLLGQCIDTGAGFNECALPGPCATDADCAFLDGVSTFVCAPGPGPAAGHCLAITSFDGSNCMDSSGCPDGQHCYTYSAYIVDQGKGECRIPCDADGLCPARAGIPHVCLDNGQGGCFPGLLGMPCTRSQDCLSDLGCLDVAPDPRRSVVSSPKVCTKPCTTDADCTSDPLIRNNGFCLVPDGQVDGVCRLTGAPGAPCERDGHCANGLCLSGGGGAGQCN